MGLALGPGDPQQIAGVAVEPPDEQSRTGLVQRRQAAPGLTLSASSVSASRTIGADGVAFVGDEEIDQALGEIGARLGERRHAHRGAALGE